MRFFKFSPQYDRRTVFRDMTLRNRDCRSADTSGKAPPVTDLDK
jgi:hypothetical protein